MKKFWANFLSAMFAAASLVTLSTAPANATDPCPDAANAFAGGTGTSADPWQIATAAQLVRMQQQVNLGTTLQDDHFVLTADIDLQDCPFTPIGRLAQDGDPSPSHRAFAGVFSGAGFKVSNLSVAGTERVGLFGRVEGATIRELTIVGANISGTNYVGAFVGEGTNVNLAELKLQNGVVTGVASVGGVAGILQSTDESHTVSSVVSSNTVVTTSYSGGGLFGATVDYPSFTEVGFKNGTVTHQVNADAVVGGLIASATVSTAPLTLERSFFQGLIDLKSSTVPPGTAPTGGGLIGSASAASLNITDSYFRGQIRTAPGFNAISGLIARQNGFTLNLTRSYSAGSYIDLSTEPPAEQASTPFGSGSVVATNSVYDSSQHTTWGTVPSAVDGRTFSELTLPETFEALSFDIETSADVLRAERNQNVSKSVWFMHPFMDDGLPIHVWAYDFGAFDVPCAAGLYSIDGLQPCIQAPAGTYIIQTGGTADAIRNCLPGTYQPDPGQSECIQAPVGTEVSSFRAITADACRAGTYQPQPGQISCLQADFGNYVSAQGAPQQVPCEPGSYQDELGQASCKAAPAGSYQDESGQAAAKLCPIGSYQPTAGSPGCINAEPGYSVASEGAITADVCRAGTYQPLSGQGNCLIAQLGHFAPEPGGIRQYECEMGTFQDEVGQASCKLAPAGRYQDLTGQSTTIACPAGYFSPEDGARFCIEASAGYFVPDAGSSQQLACPSGTTSSAGATACSPLGGGGGGGAFFPPETPGPITNNPLPNDAGSVAVGANGELLEVAVSAGEAGRSLSTTLGSSTLTLTGRAGLFGEDGKISVDGATSITASFEGLLAGSSLNVFLTPLGSFTQLALQAQSSDEPLATITVDEEGNAVLDVPLSAPAGEYLLQLSGVTSEQTAFTLVFATTISDPVPNYWPKKQSANTVKLYAKNIIGAGKVQFFLNGKEIAWVRAADETDPKLREARGFYYLVRTVTLTPGIKNVVEIHVNGERVRRAAYSLRG